MAVKKTILVVEDEDIVGELIQDIIQSEDGYRVFRVNSGSDAYAKIKNAKIDMICTDFRMPKMSGIELYELIRSSKLNQNIPIIFITGNVDDVKEKIKGDHLVNFVGKPFDNEHLISVINLMFTKASQPPPAAAKPQVDVSIMNQFINATISTLTNMANLKDVKNDPVRPLSSQGKVDDMQVEVSGLIQMSCQKFNGALIVSFPDVTLLGIYNRMLGDEKKSVDEDVASTVGELVNIIWGRTKSLLESQKLEFTSTLPTVFQGKNKIMSGNARSLSLEVPFKTELGIFHIVFTINM